MVFRVKSNLWGQHGLLCNLLLLQLRVQQQQAEDPQAMRTKTLPNDCFHFLPHINVGIQTSHNLLSWGLSGVNQQA